MRVKVVRPDGSVVWEATFPEGLLPNLSMFGIGPDDQLSILPTVPPDHAIRPPWRLEIVPGWGDDVSPKQTARPTWPQRMLMLAELWSRFSTCRRRSVGAVVYDPTTYAILGMGYNDTPIGEVDCGDGGCPPCAAGSVRNSTQCGCVHGEMNAILLSRADIRGAHLAIWNVKDGQVVVEAPCPSCHKNRIQAGIAKVLIGDGDHFEYVEP